MTDVKIGDKVIVGDWDNMNVRVTDIEQHPGGRIKFILGWSYETRPMGKSYVWAHDEGSVWRRKG